MPRVNVPSPPPAPTLGTSPPPGPPPVPGPPSGHGHGHGHRWHEEPWYPRLNGWHRLFRATTNLLLYRQTGYELFATVEGEAQPLNLAIDTFRVWRPVVRFHLLGGYVGDEARGFHLSGVMGPAMVEGLASGQPPEALGLPAYIAGFFADEQGPHMELLTRDWLVQNLGPSWWGLTV